MSQAGVDSVASSSTEIAPRERLADRADARPVTIDITATDGTISHVAT